LPVKAIRPDIKCVKDKSIFMTWFKSLGFRHKLTAGFVSVILVLSIGTAMTLLRLGKVEQSASDVVQHRQPVTATIFKAGQDLRSIEGLLHSYLLTGQEELFLGFKDRVAALETQVTSLQGKISRDEFSEESAPLDRLKAMCNELRLHANRLHELRNSFEENHPLITTAVELLNPLALAFLGQLNELIDAARDLPHNKNQKLFIHTLADLRYTWVQMMSHVRVALATHTKRDLENVRLFSEVHGKLLDDLKALEDQGVLENVDVSFDVVDNLVDLRAQYTENLSKVSGLFDNEMWRRDAHLMKTSVLPLFEQMETILDEIAGQQIQATRQAGNQLADQLGEIHFTNLAVLLAGILAAVFLTGVIVRSISNQVHEVAEVATKVGEGNLDARVEPSTNDELGQLGHRFNEMIGNLKTLNNSKDELASELREAIKNSEKANRAKSEFLSSMSHELRTPLNVILGFGQLLELNSKASADEQQTQYIQSIMKAGYHLLDLINQVLDLSMIEAGHLNIQCEAVSVQGAVAECIVQIETTLAKSRHVTLFNNTSEQLAMVLADKTRLQQVLLNLLSNAVKYNRKGGTVTIASELVADDTLRLSVTDTGEGIPKEQVSRLFDPFERLAYQHGSVEGAGIGLTITKQLAEAMGGRIGVVSTVGKGSTFWVELPYLDARRAEVLSARPAKTEVIETRPSPAAGVKCKVLYIEDNPANSRLVINALERAGSYEALTAPTAEEGLTLAEEQLPDIILMDINLPGIDGYAALNILRNVDVTRHIPVVAVSARAMDSDIKAGLDAGFDDYLTKPLDINQLYNTIDRFGPASGKINSS